MPIVLPILYTSRTLAPLCILWDTLQGAAAAGCRFGRQAAAGGGRRRRAQAAGGGLPELVFALGTHVRIPARCSLGQHFWLLGVAPTGSRALPSGAGAQVAHHKLESR